MIKKEKFVAIMKNVVAQREQDKIFSDAMGKAFPDSFAPIMPNDALWNATLQSLEELTNDKSDNIHWWIWETECGKKDLGLTIDGKKYKTKTPEQLYDIIVILNKRNS